MVKLISWNVNGIRACAKKTFFQFLDNEKPDFLCLQETKAHPDQLNQDLKNPMKYKSIWSSAEKKGYSGVAIFSKNALSHYQEGIGVQEFDREGRVLTLEFSDWVFINAYFPNGQRDHSRVPFKMKFCQKISHYCEQFRKRGKEVIICGDFNTAHQEIDLKNPKQNQNTTGFLPIERKWMSNFIGKGYIDIFRERNPNPNQYTWWSFRQGVRERNIGWRIDYFFITPGLKNKVRTVYHQPKVMGSDHCPIGLDLDLNL